MTSDQHRRYGLHSNIPECCVEAFVKLAKKYGLVGRMPKPLSSNAQYRVCEKCFHENATPAPLHICDESCREFLLTVMPRWRVDFKLAYVSGRVTMQRQKKKLASRVFRSQYLDSASDNRGVTFEFDYGPREHGPLEHLRLDEQFDCRRKEISMTLEEGDKT